MKPFDLEKALLGEPVITRDGTKVTELHLFNTSTDLQKLFAVIEGEVLCFDDNGKYDASKRRESNFDLFMASNIVKYKATLARHIQRGYLSVGMPYVEGDFVPCINDQWEFIKIIEFEVEE